MTDKIMSIAELKWKIERELKRHENHEEEISGEIGISHGLMALELRDVLKLVNSFEVNVKEQLYKWLLSQTCLADIIHECPDKKKNRRKQLELRYKYREETVGELRRILGKES